ncbi:MAG: hypothetical protein E2598_07515 [Sphingobium sp.]|nr:hypothetical protein [Sphingobium sp.]
MSIFSDHLASIHSEFADPVEYTGQGLVDAEITAIYCDEPADAFQGAGATLRAISFEIQKSDLPGKPVKGDKIVHETGAWSVLDASNHSSVAAWVVTVERRS